MLDRRQFLTLSAAAATAGLAGLPRAGAQPSPSWPAYARAVAIDALGSPGGSSGGLLTPAQLADVRDSGLTAVNITVSAVGVLDGAFEQTVARIAAWEEELALHPDVFLKVRSAADLQVAKESGRLGLIYGFQDSLPLGDSLDRLEIFDQLGVRILQLTYNRRNLAGDGCLEPADAGLSRFGHELVERMNQRGLLVDLSHSGRRTALDAIAASRAPVAITHTGCAALTALPRNKTDEELRLLAGKGGVAGIYLMPFLRTEGQPMAEDVVRHVEHAVQVCGEDHVGIGTDGVVSAVELTPEFIEQHHRDVENRRRLGISAPGESADVYTFVPDLNTPRRFEHLGRLLLDRGHSETRVAKILGGNWARLFREAWTKT